MEFPTIGSQCSEPFCRQLDFLPIKCDACDKLFCKNHMRYEDHNCTSSYKKDVQVPVCPLCNKPVPVPRGELADIKVGEHIDRDCQSDPAKNKRKAYSNKCSAFKCKQKELMPVVCSECRLNFCLRHRHPQDHDCKGFQGSGRSISQSGAAATSRMNQQSSSKKNTTTPSSSRPQHTILNALGKDLARNRVSRQQNQSAHLQGNLTEDEALAKALQLSLTDDNKPLTQEEKDLILAQQLQEEEQQNRSARRRQDQINTSQRQRENESSCNLS